MTKDEFFARTFTLRKHKPATNLGYFDATYTPDRLTLKIDIRFEIIFTNATVVWTAETKDTFKAAFAALIPEYWNNKFVIRCIKPGWTDVSAVPEFTLREAGDRHFSIKAVGTTGARNTAVRPFGTGHDQRPGTIDHATAIFGSQATERFANAAMQTQSIKEALRAPFVVPVGDHSTGGQISFSAMSHLQSFANNVAYAFARSADKPKIQLTAVGARSSSAADRIRMVLRTFGVENPIDTSRDSIFGAAQASGVRVQWASVAEYNRLFPTAEGAVPLFSQATIVHEYGHMLGLPDEYNVLCSESVSPLVAYCMVRSEGEGTELLEYNINRGAASSAAVTENQKVFVELCGKAGLVPPPFGRANMNVMSGGSRFELHHCITAWDCLCKMTTGVISPSEWQIRMAA
jgi:hypothetical protein